MFSYSLVFQIKWI